MLTQFYSLLACATEPLRVQAGRASPVQGGARMAERGAARSEGAGLGFEWASMTASPLWADEGEWSLPDCAGQEVALTRLAQAVANRQAARHAPFEVSELVVMLRALGSPHVWPRVWTLEGDALPAGLLDERWHAWLGRRASSEGERRCGGARAAGFGGRHVAAGVVVDALADLAPLPSRARLGQWLRLEARLNVPDRGGSVVLLGPRGTPRAVPSRISSDRLHSVFALDQQGLWRVQILLGTAQGPRPALEAWVFVDELPDPRAGALPAPGEIGVDAGEVNLPTLRARLLQMVNAARLSEQRGPLEREARLDLLAQAHAEAMQRLGQAAHDTGQGLPTERVTSAGVPALRVGENVAHARSLARVHRALWASPAHRGNLLDDGFDAVGLGVVVEPSIGVWVCELFVDYATTATGGHAPAVIP